MTKCFGFIFCYFCLISSVFAQDKTSNFLDSLYTLVKTSKEKDRIPPLIKLSQYYGEVQTENLDSMQYYATKALDLSKKFNAYEQQIDALYELSRASIFNDQFDISIKLSEEALKIAKENNYPLGLWKGERGIARAYLFTDKYTEGLYHFNEAYTIAKEQALPKNILFDTGVDLSTEYLILEYIDPASQILTDITPYVDDPEIAVESVGIFYTNFAAINSISKKYDEAIRYYELAIKYYKEANNEQFLVAPINNLAEIYAMIGAHKKSIATYKEALKLIHLREDLLGIVSHGLGDNYLQLGDSKNALIQLQKALEHHTEQKYIYREATDLQSIGNTYALMGNTALSKTYLNKASQRYLASIAHNQSAHIRKEEISLAYFYLSNISATQKNYKESIAYYKKHVIYKDSLNDEQNIKIAERYKLAKTAAEKDVEIGELENRNKIQEVNAEKQRNLQISLIIGLSLIAILLGLVYNRYRLKQKAFTIINDKNEENTLLMKEIHHRVKNNLQIILSLLGAQIDSHEKTPEVVDVLVESQNKIKSMAIIHQNLYQGNQFALVRVDSYTKELIANIEKSFEKNDSQIHFETDIASNLIPMGLAVPLGLILNELLTNCYKYAFEGQQNDHKKVFVGFSEILPSEEYELVVADNGIGLAKHAELKNSNAFGMQLIQGLVTQLNGNLEIFREQGTKFVIRVKSPVEKAA